MLINLKYINFILGVLKLLTKSKTFTLRINHENSNTCWKEVFFVEPQRQLKSRHNKDPLLQRATTLVKTQHQPFVIFHSSTQNICSYICLDRNPRHCDFCYTVTGELDISVIRFLSSYSCHVKKLYFSILVEI